MPRLQFNAPAFLEALSTSKAREPRRGKSMRASRRLLSGVLTGGLLLAGGASSIYAQGAPTKCAADP